MLSIYILIICAFSCYRTGLADITSNFLPNTQICGLQGVGDYERTDGIADLLESPWSALLEYDRNGKRMFSCGGTLINEKYIVTAAHCVKFLPASLQLVNVRLGEHTIKNASDCTVDTTKCSDPPLNVGIEKIISHDQYTHQNSDHINDIALIKLNTAVKFTDYIKPICLPTTSKILSNKYENSWMTVVGWGRKLNTTEMNIKEKVKTVGKSTEQCNAAYSSVSTITIHDNQLCALSSDDFCIGSGGTALTILEEGNWYMTGIVSFGARCSSDNKYPTVYTRASSFVQWIVDNLEE